MGAVAIALLASGIGIAVYFVGFAVGKSSVTPKKPKKRKAKTTEADMALIHPATGRYCLICGIDTHKSTRFHDPKQHEVAKARYCSICGAGPGEKCDAGRHG